MKGRSKMTGCAVMGFNEISMDEMFAIDGGWTTNQWITKSCAAAGFVVGGVVGYVVAGPLGA
ncbi:MAG TPA: Blp family class II bacteriocin, partial [Treponemataceae bacterium]|nr:Blp family class II bacteriocin [Treponemataceae bacterium]